MAFSRKSRAALDRLDLPSNEELVPMVEDYITRRGMTRGQFAARLGYAYTTFYYWMNGQYDRVGDDRQIRARAIELMDLEPIGDADEVSGVLHDTENARLLRSDFFFALDESKIIVRHGNPGTQKSYVTRSLIAELNLLDGAKNGHGRRAYRVECFDGIRTNELLKLIARAAGVATGSRLAILDNLRNAFRGRRVLLIIDEAQHLQRATIDFIRYLNDNPPHFGLLFLGSHDLPKKFHGFSMEQCRSRLEVLDSLPCLSREEGHEIVHKELPWMGESAIAELVRDSYTSDKEVLAKEAIVKGVRKVKPYLSARDLFRNITAIQRARAARELQKGGAA